ncbi:hypothetical protein F2Q70_00039308 [Brassica cretica]|uniref:Uncharacterized protein n=1 Tax=Brassica cretica TaxID=69181 RepID=A0A8S9KC58_BRACR|nr:hypothetical protein F2Q70_00039308 [Brassica cretica]
MYVYIVMSRDYVSGRGSRDVWTSDAALVGGGSEPSGLATQIVWGVGAETFAFDAALEGGGSETDCTSDVAYASCLFMLELNFHSGSSITQVKLTSMSDCYRTDFEPSERDIGELFQPPSTEIRSVTPPPSHALGNPRTAFSDWLSVGHLVNRRYLSNHWVSCDFEATSVFVTSRRVSGKSFSRRAAATRPHALEEDSRVNLTRHRLRRTFAGATAAGHRLFTAGKPPPRLRRVSAATTGDLPVSHHCCWPPPATGLRRLAGNSATSVFVTPRRVRGRSFIWRAATRPHAQEEYLRVNLTRHRLCRTFAGATAAGHHPFAAGKPPPHHRRASAAAGDFPVNHHRCWPPPATGLRRLAGRLAGNSVTRPSRLSESSR